MVPLISPMLFSAITSHLVLTAHDAPINLIGHCKVCALSKNSDLLGLVLSFKAEHMPALISTQLLLPKKPHSTPIFFDFLLLMCLDVGAQ